MLALQNPTVPSISEDDERGSGRIRQVEQFFGSDRATWKLLSLQTRLKQAKSPQVKAAIALQIRDTLRNLAVLYTDLESASYRAGVEFAKQNAQFYVDAERLQHRSGMSVSVRRTPTGLCMSVNGRSID